MPADSSLGDLVTLILRSMEFDNDHLYEFRYHDHLGAEVSAGHPMSDKGPYADEIAIGTLSLKPDQEMQLTYGFGDNWKFAVKSERVEAKALKTKKSHILESHGESTIHYPDWDE